MLICIPCKFRTTLSTDLLLLLRPRLKLALSFNSVEMKEYKVWVKVIFYRVRFWTMIQKAVDTYIYWCFTWEICIQYNYWRKNKSLNKAFKMSQNNFSKELINILKNTIIKIVLRYVLLMWTELSKFKLSIILSWRRKI